MVNSDQVLLCLPVNIRLSKKNRALVLFHGRNAHHEQTLFPKQSTNLGDRPSAISRVTECNPCCDLCTGDPMANDVSRRDQMDGTMVRMGEKRARETS
jgi:hypothetical protein